MAGPNVTAFILLCIVFTVMILQGNRFTTEASGVIGGCAPRRDHPEGDLNITLPGCDPVIFNVRVCDGWCPSKSSTVIYPQGFNYTCSACVPTHYAYEVVRLNCSGQMLFKLVQAHSGCACRTIKVKTV
jgi:hypothetical protein